MSEEPVTPEIVDESESDFILRQRWFRQLARTSWMSPWIGLLSTYLRSVVVREASPDHANIIAAVFGFTFVAIGAIGLGSGVVALCGVRRYGRKRIFNPAITGICVWSIIIGIIVVSLLAARDITIRNKPTVLTPSVHAPGATQVHDEELGFSFDLPSGYDLFEPPEKPYDLRCLCIRQIENERPRQIEFYALGFTLDHQRIKPSDIPSGFGQTLASFKWRGLNIEGIRSVQKQGSVAYVSFLVNIPLKTQAIQIISDARVESEDELLSIVNQLLASLEGETNW